MSLMHNIGSFDGRLKDRMADHEIVPNGDVLSRIFADNAVPHQRGFRIRPLFILWFGISCLTLGSATYYWAQQADSPADAPNPNTQFSRDMASSHFMMLPTDKLKALKATKLESTHLFPVAHRVNSRNTTSTLALTRLPAHAIIVPDRPASGDIIKSSMTEEEVTLGVMETDLAANNAVPNTPDFIHPAPVHKKQLYLGPTIFLYHTTLIRHDNELTKSYNKKSRLSLGVAYGINGGYDFSRHWGFQTGYYIKSLASQRMQYGLGDREITEDIMLEYADIPFGFKYKVDIGQESDMPFTLNFMAGGRFSMLKNAALLSNSQEKLDIAGRYKNNVLSGYLALQSDFFLSDQVYFYFGIRGTTSSELHSADWQETDGSLRNFLMGINFGLNYTLH